VWGMPAAAVALDAGGLERPLSQMAAAIVTAGEDCRAALLTDGVGS